MKTLKERIKRSVIQIVEKEEGTREQETLVKVLCRPNILRYDVIIRYSAARYCYVEYEATIEW